MTEKIAFEVGLNNIQKIENIIFRCIFLPVPKKFRNHFWKKNFSQILKMALKQFYRSR